MAIIKWVAGSFSDKPERKEYEKETAKFYIWRSFGGSIRRDAKVSMYAKYFDSEHEAVAHIETVNARRAEGRRIDNIRLHAVDILSAAERYLEFRHTSDIGMGYEFSGEHPETELKNIIAKARGLA